MTATSEVTNEQLLKSALELLDWSNQHCAVMNKHIEVLSRGVDELFEVKRQSAEMGVRIKALESALVHVAFGMHRETGTRLMEGLSLGDIYAVTVKLPDGRCVEAECEIMRRHWRDGTRP